jgi:hypothetical protein
MSEQEVHEIFECIERNKVHLKETEEKLRLFQESINRALERERPH